MNAPLYAWTGDTFIADFTVTEDGAPVDLTGATFELLVARTPGGTGFTYEVESAGASVRVFVQNEAGPPLTEGRAVVLTWSPRHTFILEEDG